MAKFQLLLFFSLLMMMSCQNAAHQEVMDWRQQRLANLQKPYGWPSVVGLYEWRNSMAYFGAADNNDFILPSTAASSFGRLIKSDTGYYMFPYSSLNVKVGEEPVEKVRLLTDKEEDGPTIASWRSLQWYLIERNDKVFLRVKDSLSEYRHNLTALDYFPINKDFRVNGRFEKATTNDSTRYENALGMTIGVPLAGVIHFEWHDRAYQLEAMNNDEESYFIVFGDATNGSSSYGGGRFLYPKHESETGDIIIDFNQSENPPCVFTPYATCPLPTETNKLDFEIVAGEKMIHLY